MISDELRESGVDMSNVLTLVGTFLAGGCCVMLVSAIVLVVWAIKSHASHPQDRARVVDPDTEPSYPWRDI